MTGMMKALVLTKPTKGSEVVLSMTEIPSVKPGWILVKVKAFGLNHSESLLRESEIENDYIKKPVIPGIECAGIIEDPSDSGWKKGDKVVALMGGMGQGSLSGKVSGINKALELVGIKTLKDTMENMEKGIVCNTGILGKVYEWNHFDPIKDIPNGVCLTGFYSNYPDEKTMQDIFTFMDAHQLKPLVGAAFSFDQLREACIALDEGWVNGKIVVKVGD